MMFNNIELFDTEQVILLFELTNFDEVVFDRQDNFNIRKTLTDELLVRFRSEASDGGGQAVCGVVNRPL